MLMPLENTIKEVLLITWPIVIVSVVILSTLRIAYIINNNKKFVLHQEVVMLLFIIYILTLFQVVTFQDASISGQNNFIFFKEISRYSIGSRLFYKNVIGNLILFIPFGFFTGYFTKIKKLTWIIPIIILASLSIETTQLFIGRVFDIDDILLNVTGGVFGYLIYSLGIYLKERLPKILQKDWFLNIIVLIGFGILLGYIYMVVK